MSLFSEIEKSIERGFRRWTERMFGPSESDELILLHRAILEEIETGVQVVARGQKIFPHARLVVTLVSPDAARRELLKAAFGGDERLQNDIREALKGAGCEVPRGFRVDVATAADGPSPFRIEVAEAEPEARTAAAQAAAVGRLVVVKGKAEESEYRLGRPRINIGRMAELTDAAERVVRRNDIVFPEGADEVNQSVSRAHAHIRLEDGEYRLADEGSEYGTRVFRDGHSIEVPPGNRRGEKLRPGDEIYLGRACLRFEA
jgi:hypothetical protein